LVKGAHQGEGLGNQFLAQIRNCDAILEVVRLFNSPNIENVLGEINPQREIEIVGFELLMKDFETLENSISKLEKKADKKDLKKIAVLKKIKEEVSKSRAVSQIDLNKEERTEIKEYKFLTQKPILYILNSNGEVSFTPGNLQYLKINLKEEEEVSELSEKEREELQVKLSLDSLIVACYRLLDLITFFTVKGGKEVRAWTLQRGDNVSAAAGTVHSDFQEKFIKAEVVGWQNLVSAGSWQKAREKGLIKVAGRDHIVQDGDVIEFKI
jgi:GTP-binding protein YchF